MTQRGDVDELSAQARAARVQDELSAQQKSALVTKMFLAEKGEYTVREIATAVGVTTGGAWRLLCNISPVLPIVEPEQRGGKWRLIV